MNTQLLENRYRILQELGQGGFGQTFLAEDLHMPSNRRCVIKQLKPVTNDPTIYQLVKERFQREAVLLERLGEGNRQIPSLFAYFTEGGQFYLVQEWIEGETLSQSLHQQGLWSSSQVTQLLMGVLPILDFIHNQGIVHRDIKPDNILLRKGDRTPVLIDFGAVKETMGTMVNTAGQTTSSIVIGTPGFMSSEQAIGRPVFSSDLYSLGLTAVYLLTGKFPNDFPNDPNNGEILWQTDAPNVDPHLAKVIDQAIATHPRDRFSNANAMLRALQTSSTIPIPAIHPIIPATSPPSIASTPTVIASPAADPSTYTESVPAYPVEPDKRAMANWQKVILTGGIISSFFLGGILLKNALISEPNNPPNVPPEPTLPIDNGQSKSPDPVAPVDPEPPANDITSAYGKYTDLIQVITCEADQQNQGDFNDYGYWEGGNDVCGETPMPGYWVYVYPDWYVWASQGDQSVNQIPPAQFMESYYASINDEAIAQAWKMLTPNFQSFSASYEEYYNWWQKTVDEVQMLDVAVLEQDRATAVVEVQIAYVIDGDIKKEKPQQYSLVWNEEMANWQIDDWAKL